MKAKTVYESLSFQRGEDPKKSLGIGVMTKFEEVFNNNYNRWVTIPRMANALFIEGAIKKKGVASKVAAFCIDIRKRGISEKPYTYKLYKEIKASSGLSEKLTLCRYAMHCYKDKDNNLIVPLRIAAYTGDKELFDSLIQLGNPANINAQISRLISFYKYDDSLKKYDWWVEFVKRFSHEDKINSGFLNEYKARLEDRLERINRILSERATEEDLAWLKEIEKSSEYSYYRRSDNKINLSY